MIFGQSATDAMVFEEHAGLVAVDVWWDSGEVAGAAIAAPKPLEVGAEIPVEVAAACASLTPDDIHLGSHPPLVLSVGLAFVVARLGEREALSRARPSVGDFVAANAAFPIEGGFALFMYVPSEEDSRHIYARMFAPLDNVLEDPATGSASAALGAFVGAQLLDDDTEVTLNIEQGTEMGRPSQITVGIYKAAGVVQRVTVGGTCIPVMQGVLTL
jgi:trans-2,3-dihydro-3-hydroxyanthranilate isomerase